MSPAGNQKIIFFDGVCNLCNGFVQFIINRDKNKVFLFAPLQSEAAKSRNLVSSNHSGEYESVIYVCGEFQYEKSTAAIKIARDLGGLWTLTGVFYIVPRPIRDWFYKIIAKNRYKIFGMRQSCMVPTPELKDRFLD